jgi:predicted transcriptional regulator
VAAWKDRSVKVGFYLPTDLVARLKKVAEDEDRPVSRIVRRLIEDYVTKKRVRRRSR